MTEGQKALIEAIDVYAEEEKKMTLAAKDEIYWGLLIG